MHLAVRAMTAMTLLTSALRCTAPAMVAMISVHRGFRSTRWLGTSFIVQAAMLVIGLLVLGMQTNCSYFRMAVALAHPRARFVAALSNAALRYAPGSQAMAERVAQALGHSRKVVEQSHGVRFVQSPQLFVCHTDCFTALVPVSKEVVVSTRRCRC